MSNQIGSLKMGQKFKKTPAGEIPVDWEARELGDLCVNKPEYGANVSAIEFQEGLPRYVRITDINDNGTLISTGVKSIRKEDAKGYQLGDGELIFARSGATVGKTYLYRKSDGPCAFAGYTIRFKPNPSYLLPDFLFQFTHSSFYYQWVKGVLRAGAQPNINGSEYSGLILPVPPIKEQDRIISILSSVDALASKISEEIEKTKELKKGLMHQLLTRGIGHKKFKKTPLGPIPAEWGVMPIKSLAGEMLNGGTPDTTNKQYWSGDIPWISGADFSDQKVDTFRRHITPDAVENSATNVIPAGALLVVTRTGVGKLAIAPVDIAISQDITGIIPKTTLISPEFMFWVLNFYIAKLKANHQGTSINGILREDLESFLLPIPPLPEQQEITRILMGCDDSLSKQDLSLTNLTTLKKGLMNMLLTGKLRVN